MHMYRKAGSSELSMGLSSGTPRRTGHTSSEVLQVTLAHRSLSFVPTRANTECRAALRVLAGLFLAMHR